MTTTKSPSPLRAHLLLVLITPLFLSLVTWAEKPTNNKKTNSKHVSEKKNPKSKPASSKKPAKKTSKNPAKKQPHKHTPKPYKPWFFIQMSDPQFGMFDPRNKNNAAKYTKEINNYSFAVTEANRLKPDFVVVTGDLIQDPGDPTQISILKRINATLNKNIPLHLVAGNHDVGNVPTPKSLAAYRKTLGPDYYAFAHKQCQFIVLNSCICQHPQKAPTEWDKHIEFLKQKLAEAKHNKARHIVLFMHHPLFIKDPYEKDGYFVIPKIRRLLILKLLKQYNVRAVFAGHYHRNAYGRDGKLEMVTTGPVGKPLGSDPSGFRIIKIFPKHLEHRYHTLGRIPLKINLKPTPQKTKPNTKK